MFECLRNKVVPRNGLISLKLGQSFLVCDRVHEVQELRFVRSKLSLRLLAVET